MPMFSRSQDFTINNGQFADHSTTNILSGPSGIDVLLEASYPEVAHDAANREYSPRCFPGTRDQYIEDIVHWGAPALGGTSTPLYWMKGPAGVGKSAIAQTCAEQLREMEKLGATFFFSINGQKKPEKFFPPIAHQLSTIFPSYRDLLDTKLRHDKTLVNRTMRSQFRYLIEEPLQELESQGNGIGNRISVIVDGLDECEGQRAQQEIIDIVARVAPDRTFPLCWAFFSRPEPHIEAAFAQPSVAPYCHKVTLPISCKANGEIELYLRNSFENILQRRSASMRSQWPSPQDIKTLVHGAHGSFIYATTAIRYVDHPGSLVPQKRLQEVIDVILNPRVGTGTDAPFAALDLFYTLILKRVPPEIYQHVHLLLALLCQCVGLGAVVAANALGMSKDESEAVCNCIVLVLLSISGTQGKISSLTVLSTPAARIHKLDGTSWVHFIDEFVSNLEGRSLSTTNHSWTSFLIRRAQVHIASRTQKHWQSTSSKCISTIIEGIAGKTQLVLALGVTDSASSLSYPHTNELFNSLIKASAYALFGHEDSHSFSAPRVRFGRLDTKCDFRKCLHVYTYLMSCDFPLPIPGIFWGLPFDVRSHPGTWIASISLSEFNVTEFKSMVKQRKKANVIRRYHSSLFSRIGSLFGKITQPHFESVVYRVGYGEKSIFWYWEINYDLDHYREFQTIDLAEGERRFREEDFASWPSPSWSDTESE